MDLQKQINELENKISNIDKELTGTTLTYSRTTGYYRPIEYWSDGKVQEYRERKEYDLGGNKYTKKDDYYKDILEERSKNYY